MVVNSPQSRGHALHLFLVLFLLVGVAQAASFEEKLSDPSFSLFRLAVLSTYPEPDDMPTVTGALFPTDEAFDAVPEGILGWFFSNPSALKSLVDFHLLRNADGQTFNTPNELVWQTVETLEGSLINGLMVDGKVVVAGAAHDMEIGRNMATIEESGTTGGMFQTNRLLFPESLVPCQSSKECASGSNCRWYSQPTDSVCGSPDATPGALVVNFGAAGCQALATCQSCSSSMGATCNGNAECCGSAMCGQSGCCAPIGSSCDTAGEDSTCCSGTCGDANTCCIADGAACRHTDECCFGGCSIDPTQKNNRICRRNLQACDGTNDNAPCLPLLPGVDGRCNRFGSCMVQAADCQGWFSSQLCVADWTVSRDGDGFCNGVGSCGIV
eukprot:TRINITY_DN67960_c6_g1_i1.p1 TRINITY_DN67960_c6_g1~~TRINITY_DN67960_c6_g1_i1.p1  ORF type:complete len:384 (-),score=39.43 TRINITY_DN67960_c6_g1_i1:223-1374(-)